MRKFIAGVVVGAVGMLAAVLVFVRKQLDNALRKL